MRRSSISFFEIPAWVSIRRVAKIFAFPATAIESESDGRATNSWRVLPCWTITWARTSSSSIPSIRISFTIPPSCFTRSSSRSWGSASGAARCASRSAIAAASGASTKIGSTVPRSFETSTTAWVPISWSGTTSLISISTSAPHGAAFWSSSRQSVIGFVSLSPAASGDDVLANVNSTPSPISAAVNGASNNPSWNRFPTARTYACGRASAGERF